MAHRMASECAKHVCSVGPHPLPRMLPSRLTSFSDLGVKLCAEMATKGGRRSPKRGRGVRRAASRRERVRARRAPRASATGSRLPGARRRRRSDVRGSLLDDLRDPDRLLHRAIFRSAYMWTIAHTEPIAVFVAVWSARRSCDARATLAPMVAGRRATRQRAVARRSRPTSESRPRRTRSRRTSTPVASRARLPAAARTRLFPPLSRPPLSPSLSPPLSPPTMARL